MLVKPKRILVLTYFYYPDISACSFRMTALVDKLVRLYPDVLIDVLTTEPSRYASFKPMIDDVYESPNLCVHRVKVPMHNNGMRGEFISSVVFYRKALKFVKDKEYDVVVTTTAKLGTGVLGTFISRLKGAKSFIDIRDLFVCNVRDMFNPRLAKILTPPLKFAERYTLKHADIINVVSSGFKHFIPANIAESKIREYTNGIDAFIYSQQVKNENRLLKILYTGNVGRAQSLEKIIPKLATLLKGKAEFFIVGDGRKNAELFRLLDKYKIDNVTIHPPVPRCELNNYFAQADILFLHLDNCECLSHVIPSKLYEYAFTGLPIIAGANGFTRQFIEEKIDNAVVFEPNNHNDCVKQLAKLKLERVSRNAFINEFSRDKIMNKMANEIVGMI